MKYRTTDPYEIRLAERRLEVSRLGQRLACLLLQAWLRYRQWRSESEAIRHLRNIDDHLLDDVGINRWDIEEVVRGSQGFQENAHRHPGPKAADHPPRRNGGLAA